VLIDLVDVTATSVAVTSGQLGVIGTTALRAPAITALAPTATTISFVATDPDSGSLNLSSTFFAAFGAPAVANGTTTVLVPDVQGSALAGILTVSDGTHAADVVGLFLGTAAGDIGTAPSPGLANALYGFAGNDWLIGAAGGDMLSGGDGNDLLDGAAGADALFGGVASDTYIVDDVGDTVTEAAGEGTDTVRTTLSSYALGAGVERLTFVGSGDFVGTGNELANILTGGAGNDTLSGLDGNDTLDGKAGADAMAGGTGNDVYVVDDVGDGVTEVATEGIDTVRTTLSSYALGAEVERLTFSGVGTGSGDFTGTGNGLANILTGGAGNDTLDGGDGNDKLDGDTGADAMAGGSGNDRYSVDDAGDAVTEAAGEGIDTVLTTLSSYTLGAEVERLTFSGTGIGSGIGSGDFVGTGNALANILTGGDGNDTLSGGGGKDRVQGGAGNDTFVLAATADSVIRASDTITDFVPGADLIDLAAIAGVDFFQGPIGDGTIAANSIGWRESGGNTIVYVNKTAAGEAVGSAQMAIVLTGTGLGLSDSDFLLA
jgi:Ca2+-binding RTX toxin-like protein